MGLCLGRDWLIDVTRVDEGLCIGSTRGQAFEVGRNLKTRGVGHCTRCDLPIDGHLEDILRSKSVPRRPEGGDALFFQPFEDRPQGTPYRVARVRGEPGLHAELDIATHPVNSGPENIRRKCAYTRWRALCDGSVVENVWYVGLVL